MKITTLFAFFALSLSPLAVVGCADDSSEPAPESDEADVVTATDTALKKEIGDAIAGLETGGGEGDADPFKVADVKLRRGETMTDDVLLKRLLPKLMGVSRDDDPIPGLDATPIAKAWADYTATPKAEDYETAEELAAAKAAAEKWKNVKKIFDTKLTNVKYFDMGYRSSPQGSLETGAVAHVFVGQTPTGRIIAIWGIDIWT
jgi:hypothetical protein